MDDADEGTSDESAVPTRGAKHNIAVLVGSDEAPLHGGVIGEQDRHAAGGSAESLVQRHHRVGGVHSESS